MKTLATLPLLLLLMASCSKSAFEVSSSRVQEQMREVDKTDYAKIDTKTKSKIEASRKEEYHQYANDADKKLNHHKNEQLNKKKGWDGDFSFY